MGPLVLQIATVVAKARLPLARSVWLHGLDLALQRVIDTLSLVDRVVQALGASDLLHRHVWTERHALVNMPSRGQGVRALLLRIVPTVCASVGASVHTLRARLLHRG